MLVGRRAALPLPNRLPRIKLLLSLFTFQMRNGLNLDGNTASADSTAFKPRFNVNWKEIFEGVDEEKQ